MDHTIGLAKQTAELHSMLMSDKRIEAHPAGHSAKVLRYRTRCGQEIAVEKRIGAPVLYFTRSAAEGRIDDLAPDWLPAGRNGRNSNLNVLETFRDRPLARLRVTTLETARKALDACVSR